MSERTCTIPGCDRRHYGRGWCRMHYRRWERHGDPLATSRIVGDDDARLWSKIDRRGDDECWPWRTPDVQGYGCITVGGKKQKAHRIVYETMVGPIPDGMVIDHLCHDPKTCDGGKACPHRRCCNPRHLVAASSGANNSAERQSHVNKRKTHCPQGHLYDEANTYLSKAGKRHCKVCVRANKKAFRDRRRAAAIPAELAEQVLDGLAAAGRE